MVSQCCHAEDRGYSADLDFSDLNLCPECRDHCDFIRVLEFSNGDVEVIDGDFYSEGKRITDEGLIYELEQILNERTKWLE